MEKKAGYVALDEKDIKSEDDLDKSERMARIAIDEAFKDAMIDYSTNEEEIALSLSTSVAGSDYLNKYVMNEEAKWILNSKAYTRSEERRVGKECLRLCRSRWSPYH